MAESTQPILEETIKYRLLRDKIHECYHTNSTHSTILHGENSHLFPIGADVHWCPRMYDGFTCWDETPANFVAVQSCPSVVIGFDPTREVFKNCTENGTWYAHPEAQRPWTNYTLCFDVEDLIFREIVNNIYVCGYSISVFVLLLSLLIFASFRTLRCIRTIIHMHLFSSFTINNVLWIIWHKAVVIDIEVLQQNPPWCQILHLVMNYFMVTSYLWMFCKGLHLHLALVMVFMQNRRAMICFMALGWGLSFLIVMVYGIVRFNIHGGTERCWMEQHVAFWIINIPVVLSMLASLVFFINVVHVLVTKINTMGNQQTRNTVKRAARAALILIPLFGLHYILIPLRPGTKEPGERAYQIISALITSFQGFALAVLFCFTNNEVITAITAFYHSYMDRAPPQPEAFPMTGLTGGGSFLQVNLWDHNMA